ncbi:MAG TPA: DUF4404 family protein [Lacipirellulaceae bacterium]|nr:DUF4404 family protein [Lacipirellulaceae bacterium]
MDRKRVLEALDVLGRELEDAPAVGADARASLRQVSADIRQMLAERESAGPDDAEAASALKEALLEFETEHPQLTGAINQVAAALANLGI